MATKHADPHQLLVRAMELLRESEDPKAKAWLEDYKTLPGAELSDALLNTLAASKRMSTHKAANIKTLIHKGYLQSIDQVSRNGCDHRVVIRTTAKGREALRLRSSRA